MKGIVAVKKYLLLLLMACIFTGCGRDAESATTAFRESNETETSSSQIIESEIQSQSTESLEVHMTNAMDSRLELDINNRYIMTLEEVEVRGLPKSSAAVNRTVSYQLVNVYAVVYSENYGEDDRWALIGFNCFDSMHDNIGWVKLTDLVEYTEENKELLYYPVQLTEGCKDIETGQLIAWTDVAVEYVEDYAIIHSEGGRSHKVKPEDIVYPEFSR